MNKTLLFCGLAWMLVGGAGTTLAVVVPPSGPDFVISAISIAPTVSALGGRVMATVTVLNQGTLSGKAGTLYTWRDKLATATVGEPCDKSVSINTLLKPGQTKTVNVAFTAPQVWGTLHFRAFVDAKNVTKEKYETNNQWLEPYYTSLPDFEIVDVQLSSKFTTAGQTFTAYVIVINSGEVAGDAGYLDVWTDSSTLATIPVPGAKTKGNKYKTIGTLQPGQEKTITVTGLKAPAGTEWTLGVLVDSRAKTLELYEDNNWFELDY